MKINEVLIKKLHNKTFVKMRKKGEKKIRDANDEER